MKAERKEYFITIYMEKSPPWEADGHSASQELIRLYVHYRVHKGPLLDPNLSRINLLHTLTSNLTFILILSVEPW
jgi:hypothetical protein